MSIQYRINGRTVTKEEWDALPRHEIQGGTPDDPVSGYGGHSAYWGLGHRSISAAVHPGQAKEHHEWIKEKGLTGVEVRPSGAVVTSSPRNRERYLTARGFADYSSSGAKGACGGSISR